MIKHILYILTAVAILLPISLTTAQALETRLAPVVDPMLDIITLRVDSGKTVAYVEFTKVRDCTFVAIHWYNDIGQRIGLEFKDDSEFTGGLSRPEGDHVSGPWVIHTNDIDKTYAEVLHECHPAWTTKTRLFQGKDYNKNG